MNNISIIGRLTRDPETKTSTNGAVVTTFTVAVDRNFTASNGKKETDFIPVVTWRGLAETCGKYLAKGKQVGVDGRLQIRTYETSDGNKRTVAEIVANNVEFLSPKSESRGNDISPSFAPSTPATDDNLLEIAPFEGIPF